MSSPLNLKGSKLVGRNILPQRKINTNHVHWPKCSPLLKWELGRSNSASRPVSCTLGRVQIFQIECALLELGTGHFDELTLSVASVNPRHTRWKYSTTSQPSSPSTGIQVPVPEKCLGENLIHPLSGILEKYQGRKEASSSLQRDPGVLGIPLGYCLSAWVSRQPTQESLKDLLKMWIWGLHPRPAESDTGA